MLGYAIGWPRPSGSLAREEVAKWLWHLAKTGQPHSKSNVMACAYQAGPGVRFT